MVILVPVKKLACAKQRLSTVLDAAERTALAGAMLEDVLQTLAAWAKCPPVALVTSDPRACRLAQQFSFEVIEDPTNRSESDAIAMATGVSEAEGASGTLVLPGDIPLVRVSELEEMVAAAPPVGTVLVSSADGRGTNAVWRRPAALFPLSFGGDSFLRHWQAARATGKPCTVLRLPGIALDVDTPEDLARLLAADGNGNAHRLLRAWNVPERLLTPTRV
ncbi:MAG: 2-phospho-L-lactate guanylyltransferase [Terriglobia bacterium]